MSIVAISQTLGSLGDDIGRRLARVLAYDFADREILRQAAERFGEDPVGLHHATEDRPTLWERVAHAERRPRAYVEAIIWEMAAQDRVVLVDRGSPFVLQGIGHAVRVRVTASERVRVHRLAEREEIGAHAVAGRVRQDIRERAAGIRFLYHVDWDDPSGYDLVLNTDRLDVDGATGLIQDALSRGAFQTTEELLAQVRDRSLVARPRRTPPTI